MYSHAGAVETGERGGEPAERGEANEAFYESNTFFFFNSLLYLIYFLSSITHKDPGGNRTGGRVDGRTDGWMDGWMGWDGLDGCIARPGSVFFVWL